MYLGIDNSNHGNLTFLKSTQSRNIGLRRFYVLPVQSSLVLTALFLTYQKTKLRFVVDDLFIGDENTKFKINFDCPGGMCHITISAFEMNNILYIF
jgi:hypothetical protein